MTATSTTVTVSNVAITGENLTSDIDTTLDTVVVANVAITEKPVKLISMLGRIKWRKIRYWRGLRKDADVTPDIK